MRLLVKILLTVFLASFPFEGGKAQENADNGTKPPPTTRAQRKAEKKKWKETRKRKRRAEKAIKAHHKRIQSDDTRKRMKKNYKKAQRVNDNRKEFFIKRWFRKKPKKTG